MVAVSICLSPTPERAPVCLSNGGRLCTPISYPPESALYAYRMVIVGSVRLSPAPPGLQSKSNSYLLPPTPH